MAKRKVSMAQKEAQKRYEEKLRKAGIKRRKQFFFSLHVEKDKDLIARLEAQPSKAAYLKKLIGEDIGRG